MKNFVPVKNLGFKRGELDAKIISTLESNAKIIRGDIIKMTTVANSGHPGGAMGAADWKTLLYSCINPKTDEVVESAAHYSAGVYPLIVRNFRPKEYSIEDVLTKFRLCGSGVEGHVEHHFPMCTWSGGILGMGISVRGAFAYAKKAKRKSGNVYINMGDGEQQVGQIWEAARKIPTLGVDNITGIIDFNGKQISGNVDAVGGIEIPFLRDMYEQNSWSVDVVDGHNIPQIYNALKRANISGCPAVIIAKTVMGKGFSATEGDHKWHGAPLPKDMAHKALAELGAEDNLEELIEKRKQLHKDALLREPMLEKPELEPVLLKQVNSGLENFKFSNEGAKGMRVSYGEVLKNLKDANRKGYIKGVDCDLGASTKLSYLEEDMLQFGISEYNAATFAGALSKRIPMVFFSTFGEFATNRVKEQLKINAINETNLNVVATHIGTNVGEDGKTHHCVDYMDLRGIPGMYIIIPADANQTAHAVDYVARHEGNFFVGLPRTDTAIITKSGQPVFGKDYKFNFGTFDALKCKCVEEEQPVRNAIFSMGRMTTRALEVSDILDKQDSVLVDVINVPWAAYSDKYLRRVVSEYDHLFVMQDHLNGTTGLDNTIFKAAYKSRAHPTIKRFGLSTYSPSGSPDELDRYNGLDKESLRSRILEAVK